MLFEKKDGEPEKIRVVDPDFWTGWKWVTIRKGDSIDIPEADGLCLGLVPVKSKIEKPEPRPKPKSVEERIAPEEDSKKKESELYKQKLQSIKGVGEKTVKDIIQIYPSETDLINALNSKKDVPIRDDLAKEIRNKFRIIPK